jgi:hypothetical protein
MADDLHLPLVRFYSCEFGAKEFLATNASLHPFVEAGRNCVLFNPNETYSWRESVGNTRTRRALNRSLSSAGQSALLAAYPALPPK